MDIQQAKDEYRKALRKGHREFRLRVAKGAYPYLQVLDDILENTQVERIEPLGLVNIPMESIVGTKTEGRKAAFAANFMPLLEEGTEFQMKWTNLCAAHMNEGIRDPIKAFEFMNRFYVQEGNKRVSVLKYFDAASIPGYVTRVVPRRSGSKGSEIYHEFLAFYDITKVNFIGFSEQGRFERLLMLTCNGKHEPWTEEQKRDFASVYYTFAGVFEKLGGKKLPITPGDALLMYLELYPYDQQIGRSSAEMEQTLEALWPEVVGLTKAGAVEVSMEPENHSAPLLSRILPLEQFTVNAAFLYEKSADTSAWVYAHEFGRSYVEEALPNRVYTHVYDNIHIGTDDDEVIERAIRDGSSVIFTTTPKLLGASLRAAARHPEVKILNCSLNMPHPTIRTYYGRLYEAKFILGAIAGALTENDKIGYFATYPIYGMTAGVNAFAIGAKLVNPRARIYLQWTSHKDGRGLDLFKEKDIHVISSPDTGLPKGERAYGVYLLTRENQPIPMAMPFWHWGEFYEKILRSILNNTWKADTAEDGCAVNYWWGIGSGMIDVLTSRGLPPGTKRLTEFLKQGLCEGKVDVFGGEVFDQGGRLVTPQNGSSFTPEEILKMDWLADNIVGQIPAFDDLIEIAKPLVKVQGIYRKEGQI